MSWWKCKSGGQKINFSGTLTSAKAWDMPAHAENAQSAQHMFFFLFTKKTIKELLVQV